jgi:parallel beta-helix repeat protein
MARRVSGAIIAMAVVSCLAFSAGQAAASPVSCGDTITTDTKLHRDLVNCPNNGIVIGANNIKLDLNGHRIDGNAQLVGNCPTDEFCDVGVLNEGHNGVTIEGGKVREFDLGAVVFGTTDNRLRDLCASTNSFGGVFVVDSSKTRIKNNSLDENGTSGLVFDRLRDSVIRGNSAVRNGHSTLFMFRSTDNLIEKNRFAHNGDGIEMHESTRNRLRMNSISHSQGAAISVDLGAANRVSKNRIDANGDGVGLFESRRNRISHNTVTGTGLFGDPESGGFGLIFDGADRNLVVGNSVTGGRGPAILVTSLDSQDTSDRNVVLHNVTNSDSSDGIRVGGGAIETLIKRNLANHSGDDGIDVNAAGTKVTRNTANRNHELGIEAVPGVIDGGGNKASGNGNPAQCTNVACQ